MKNMRGLIFAGLSIILVMNFFVPSGTAGTDYAPEPDNLTNLYQPVSGNSSPMDGGINSSLNITNQESDDTSVSLTKKPKTKIIYAGGKNSPDSSGEEKPLLNETAKNSTDSARQYNSLGEILKANDWKALSEYKCRIKKENSNLFDDSNATLSSKEEKWDSYFNPPPTSAPIGPCCG